MTFQPFIHGNRDVFHESCASNYESRNSTSRQFHENKIKLRIGSVLAIIKLITTTFSRHLKIFQCILLWLDFSEFSATILYSIVFNAMKTYKKWPALFHHFCVFCSTKMKINEKCLIKQEWMTCFSMNAAACKKQPLLKM